MIVEPAKKGKSEKHILGARVSTYIWSILLLAGSWSVAIYLFVYEIPWNTSPEEGSEGVVIVVVAIWALTYFPAIYVKDLETVTFTDTKLIIRRWFIIKEVFDLNKISSVSASAGSLRWSIYMGEIKKELYYPLGEVDH